MLSVVVYAVAEEPLSNQERVSPDGMMYIMHAQRGAAAVMPGTQHVLYLSACDVALRAQRLRADRLVQLIDKLAFYCKGARGRRRKNQTRERWILPTAFSREDISSWVHILYLLHYNTEHPTLTLLIVVVKYSIKMSGR